MSLCRAVERKDGCPIDLQERHEELQRQRYQQRANRSAPEGQEHMKLQAHERRLLKSYAATERAMQLFPAEVRLEESGA